MFSNYMYVRFWLYIFWEIKIIKSPGELQRTLKGLTSVLEQTSMINNSEEQYATNIYILYTMWLLSTRAVYFFYNGSHVWHLTE